jgi:hypothetical protein
VIPVNISSNVFTVTGSGVAGSYGQWVNKYGQNVADALKNILGSSGGVFIPQGTSGTGSSGGVDLNGLLGDIPLANDGDVITAEYHNALRMAMLVLASALGGTPTSLTWGNNSKLSADQGGSIELGGDLQTAGTGTPYIDFHFKDAKQDFNARVTNDGDGQLSIWPNVLTQPSLTSVLAVHGERGIRQERLYLSGGTQSNTWSSISFNAQHVFDANGNVQWHFPDPSHPAVTIEMDAAPGHGRFQIFATTTQQPTQWPATPLLDINGDSGDLKVGDVTIKGETPELDIGSLTIKGDQPQAGHTGVTITNSLGLISADSLAAASQVGIVDANHTAIAYFDNTGKMVARSKQFVIDHPLEDGRQLAHATLEGPEHCVFYRGEAQLQDGRATIALPEYFEALCRPEGRSVQLTPKLEGPDERPGVIGATEVKDGQFSVVAARNSRQSQRFYWEVKAVRADIDELEVEPERKASPVPAAV